jgi:DNA polymerase-1
MGLIEAVEKEIKDKMAEAIRALGNVAPEAIQSAKQLGNILFSEWGLKPWSLTGKGAPCTAKGDLMWIQWAVNTGSKGYAVNKDIVEKMNHVMSYKTQATLISKYINGLKEALEHTNDGYIYPVPRLFGTYTGRMTYSSNTFKDGPKVSIAMHQVPRKAKNIRELLTLPEGMLINENDASGQESRLMAMRSGDPTMIKIFNDGLNFHSMTGSNIIGRD